MKDLMIDIETLDVSSTAVITQIAACLFDIDTGEVGEGFCKNIGIQDCLYRGRTISGDTLKFWINQILQTGNCTWIKHTNDLSKVLHELRQYLNVAENIWCHDFDWNIIGNAYNSQKESMPYRKFRDIRTLMHVSGLKKEDIPAKEGVAKTHDAMDDVLYQIHYVSYAWNNIKSC